MLPRASFVCKFDQSHVKPMLRVRARVTDSTQLSRASIAMIETKRLAYDVQTSRHLTLRFPPLPPSPPTFPFLTCSRPAGNLSLRISELSFLTLPCKKQHQFPSSRRPISFRVARMKLEVHARRSVRSSCSVTNHE